MSDKLTDATFRRLEGKDGPHHLFASELAEWKRHVEVMRNERTQKTFLLNSILRIALAVNDKDPITAAELLDVIDDCEKQINKFK